MARVRLRRRDIAADRLPRVCMVCGKDGTTSVRKSFAVTPSWAVPVGLVVILLGQIPGIIIFWIVLEAVKQRVPVDVPMCDRHRGYFMRRTIWKTILTLPCFVVPVVVVATALIVTDERDAPMVAILSGILSFVVTVIVVALTLSTIHNAGIRTKEIDDRYVTLNGVHEKFEQTVSGPRDDWDDDDDRPRRRRPPRADAIEDVLPAEPPPDHRESYRDRREPDDPRYRRRRGEEYEE